MGNYFILLPDMVMVIGARRTNLKGFPPSLLVPVSSLLSAVALSTRDGAFLSFLDPKAFLTVFLSGDKNIFGCVVLAGS